MLCTPISSTSTSTSTALPGALSAYILFTKEERNQVRAPTLVACQAAVVILTHSPVQILKEKPGLGVTDVMKEAAARWKTLSAQQKEPFEEMAKKDKERYNQEMLKYKATQSDD